MNTYDFTYTIKEISENGKAMVITYSCDGFDPVDIGARIPYADETIESVVDMYAPTVYWNEQSAVHATVTVGQAGQHTHVLPNIGGDPMDGMTEAERIEAKRTAKLSEVSNSRRNREQLTTVIVDGHPVSIDPVTQSKLVGLAVLQSQGKFTQINWRDADGNFFTMTETILGLASDAVRAEVQALFDWEKITVEQITAATIEAELDAINI